MTEIHRHSLTSARRSDKMFTPEGGGVPPPASTGLSLGVNGTERTNPSISTTNTAHALPMPSVRTPLPNSAAASYETAGATVGAGVVSSSQSTTPAPSLIPVGDGDFLSLSPLGVICGNQAVFMSSSAEMPPSAPVAGIGADSSVALDLAVHPPQSSQPTGSRVANENFSPENLSTGVALDAEVPTRTGELHSNIVAEQGLGGTSTTDLNIGYNLDETQVVSESPTGVDELQAGVASEAQPVNDEGFDDVVVFQDDTLTTMAIPAENDSQPPSLCEPVQIINTPPLEPMPPKSIEISEVKVSSSSGEVATGQDVDIQRDENKHLPWDSNQRPASDGIKESVVVKASAGEEKCKEEGLDLTKPHTEGAALNGGEEICKEEGLDSTKPQVNLSQADPFEDEEKKGEEFMPMGDLVVPSAEKREVATEPDVQALVGRKVAKKFGRKTFTGKVVGYDVENQWFKVVYEDGDEEDLERVEVEEILEVPGNADTDAHQGKRKRSSPKGGSKKQARKSVAKSQDREKAQGKSKRKGSSVQTKKTSQKGKSSKESKQRTSKTKSLLPKAGGTGAGKSLVKSGRKRQTSSDVEAAVQVRAVPKTTKTMKGSPKKGGSTETKGSSKRKGARHQSLSDLSSDQSRGKRRKVAAIDDPESFIGRLLKKNFNGTLYKGKVTNFNRETGFFKVKYDDGDQEDLEWKELKVVLVE